MSDKANETQKNRELLKHMILELHAGKAPEQVKERLKLLLGDVPYDDVVAVEQELIAEGLPQKEVLKLCDIHSQVLKGSIDQSGAKTAPAGHPVHTFIQENLALAKRITACNELYEKLTALDDAANAGEELKKLKGLFAELREVEKHYVRKENVLFPFLEKHEITGPPQVMWGKHDEARALLNAAEESLTAGADIKAGEAKSVIDLVLKPTTAAIEEMFYKEEKILFPMCLDTLTDEEWQEIYSQSQEVGFCLYTPANEWGSQEINQADKSKDTPGRINLPSGSFSVEELTATLNSLPFDMTFVDKDDTVRYFTEGKDRVFPRSRAIVGRKVQMCHPPDSVHIVEKIVADFRAGKQDVASFWITLNDKFIHIEYYAVRNEAKEYLGTIEVSRDITEIKKLDGEQRLLSYGDKDDGAKKD